MFSGLMLILSHQIHNYFGEILSVNDARCGLVCTVRPRAVLKLEINFNTWILPDLYILL